MEDCKREEKLYKEPIYRSISSSYYAIFRVGKKMKSLGQIRTFTLHMERMKETPNANPLIENKLLVGDKKLMEEIKEYTKDVRYIRKDTVMGRELLLTASPDFFRGLSKEQFDRWVQLNLEWLTDEFKDNLKYAVLHLDEHTAHIHAFICPKIYSELRQCYILSNRHYFNGIEKFRGWQDKYAGKMQTVFKSLQRGIRYSKAKHVNINKYYALVNSKMDEKDIESIKAKAIESELLKIKIKSMQKTIESYKKYNTAALKENDILKENNKKLIEDKTNKEEIIKLLSKYNTKDCKEKTK